MPHIHFYTFCAHLGYIGKFFGTNYTRLESHMLQVILSKDLAFLFRFLKHVQLLMKSFILLKEKTYKNSSYYIYDLIWVLRLYAPFLKKNWNIWEMNAEWKPSLDCEFNSNSPASHSGWEHEMEVQRWATDNFSSMITYIHYLQVIGKSAFVFFIINDDTVGLYNCEVL